MIFEADVYNVEFFVSGEDPFFSWCGIASFWAETKKEAENIVKKNNEEHKKGNAKHFLVLKGFDYEEKTI